MTETHDAIVIGAGFSGLAILHHLREIGLDTVVLDAQDGVGGTWLANRYPGVRTDSEYSYYSFSFSKEVREEWTWTQRYPAGGAEVLAYLNFVADRLDLRRDIRLETRVESAVYDEAANTWTVYVDGGAPPLVAKYLISGMGVLSQAIYPDIPPGIDSFAGEKHHTAHWPRDGVDLAGKRVGLIGLGASGIQLVPEIGPQVGEFVVFQRTPNFIVESTNDAVTAEDMAWLRDNYDAIYEKAANHSGGGDGARAVQRPGGVRRTASGDLRGKWNEGGFHFANECFNDLATNHAASELASEFIRAKIREIVRDPATADLLSPKTYSFNGKRVPTGHGYYEAFNLDHVRLVDTATTPITAITPTGGVRVGDTEYELDVLIFATGFDAMTGTLTNIDIVGREGITLRDRWERDGLRSHLGIGGVHGFPPNFFMSLGRRPPRTRTWWCRSSSGGPSGCSAPCAGHARTTWTSSRPVSSPRTGGPRRPRAPARRR